MGRKEVKIGGINISYLEEGEGDPVLILHGWGSRAAAWENVQRSLAARGFRVVALDLPGFGESDEPPYNWDLEQYAEFVNAAAEKLSFKNFTLLGHSFGGRIAIFYAYKYGNKINALVLAAAAGVMRHKKAKVTIFGILTKIGNGIFALPVLSFLRPKVEKVWYKITGEHDYRKATPRMKEVMKNALKVELAPYLESIKVPTLILWGDKDAHTPLSDAMVLNRKIPNAHLHVFPGAPHGLNIKVPKKVAAQVSKFIKEL